MERVSIPLRHAHVSGTRRALRGMCNMSGPERQLREIVGEVLGMGLVCHTAHLLVWDVCVCVLGLMF